MTEKMIPDLQGALVCEDVRQEMNPASQTLVGVLGGLQAPQFPATALKLFIWVRWCAGRGEFTQKAKLIAPDQETVVRESEVKFKLPDEHASTTNVTFFPGVQFQQPGIYWVEVFLDGELKIRFPFPVMQIKPPQPAQHG
ncbi:MAG: hypothetical protein HZA91_15005 [Verrucomicrobia bacterium]|nr:hypothetical protein [Verrucomicrobiota bacterium]